MRQQTNAAKRVDVNPADYPNVYEACLQLREDALVNGQPSRADFVRIFEAAKVDGLIDQEADYEDYHESLAKDLHELVIEPKSGDDMDIEALLASLGM